MDNKRYPKTKRLDEVYVYHGVRVNDRYQWLENPDGEPVPLLVRKESGHMGGTTISDGIEQGSEELAFLMDQVGMKR